MNKTLTKSFEKQSPGLQNIWQRLIEPSPSVTGTMRRRVRLLSSLLIVLAPLTIISSIGPRLIFHNYQVEPIYVVIDVALWLAYFLSRTRYHVVAALLTIAIIDMGTWSSVMVLPANTAVNALSFLMTAVLLTSILFSAWATLGVVVINAIGILLLPYVLATAPDTSTPLIFLVVVSTLLLVSMRHRDGLEKDRQDELAQALYQTKEANTDLLKANALAKEATRLKSEFLSTMSHELRTPLNSIVGFTDILLTGKPGVLNPTQQNFLERVAGNNRRLLKLINDILDLSRIEAGRMEIFPVAYAPRDLLERIAAQTSTLFSHKNVAFEMMIDSQLPEQVVGDRDRVEQIVVNLLSNAAKFTNEGRVELNAGHLKNDTWTISVKDTGIGLAPHTLEMIFEPFRQVDGSTTRQHGGSGLGLAIVRELCQMMNGQIQVVSEVGQGSTFTVVLPLGEAPDKVAAVPLNIAFSQVYG